MQNVLISFTTKLDNLFLIDNTQLSHKTLNQKLLNNDIIVAKSDKKSVGLLILDFYGVIYLSFHLFGLTKSLDG